MRRLLMLSIFAAVIGSVAPSPWSPAHAQVGIEIGPRGPRVYDVARQKIRSMQAKGLSPAAIAHQVLPRFMLPWGG